MKILILSDTHGCTENVKLILREERNADMIIHLGDGGADMFEMNFMTAGKPLYQIKGNCDISAYNFSPKLVSYADKVKFFACHGHMYNVKNDLTALYYAASEYECNVALFGHTHIPYKDEYNGITLFNPGSAMNGRYGILLASGENFTLEHKQLRQ